MTAAVLLFAVIAAQVDTATLNASVGSLARLTLSSNNITFADADPDTVTDVTSSPRS